MKYHDIGQINDEIARFRRCAPKGTFMEDFATAPSPGIVATTLQNAFYDSHERYLDALARELRHEYRAIHDAGLMLQIDAPDLAMERTMLFQDLSDADFLKMCELHLHAINTAVEGIPRDRWRLHVCWGNWEGPHEHDVPLGSILSILYKTTAGALTIEFANPRHAHEYDAIRKAGWPKDMILIPGVIEIDQQFRRASGSGGEANCGGRRRGRRPRARHRLDRLRLRHICRPRMGRRLRWCGRSLNHCARAPISRPRGCGGSRARRNDYARLGCTASPSTFRAAVTRTAVAHATQKASRYDVTKITPLHPAIRGSIRNDHTDEDGLDHERDHGVDEHQSKLTTMTCQPLMRVKHKPAPRMVTRIPVKVDRGPPSGRVTGSISSSMAHLTAAWTRVATPALRMALSRWKLTVPFGLTPRIAAMSEDDLPRATQGEDLKLPLREERSPLFSAALSPGVARRCLMIAINNSKSIGLVT